MGYEIVAEIISIHRVLQIKIQQYVVDGTTESEALPLLREIAFLGINTVVRENLQKMETAKNEKEWNT